MEKQKLAQMVLQKMKQKKALEQKNRPHYQVLQMEAKFAYEFHNELKNEISFLESTLKQQQKNLQQLQQHIQELDNTGKKNYPRIIVKPEFIASEHVKPEIKEFYRKTSNNFLKNDILRNKAYEESLKKQKQLVLIIQQVKDLENNVREKLEKDRNVLNEKRLKVLKQDLRLRFIKLDQQSIKQQIQLERQNNIQLIEEYELKQGTLDSRKQRLAYVERQIQMYKEQIQKKFNPIAYRQHLKNVFNIELKSERMNENISLVQKDLKKVEKQNKVYQKIIQKTRSLNKLGRLSDSPSMKYGTIQKRLQRQKQNSYLNSQSKQSSREKINMSISPMKMRSSSQKSFVHSSLQVDLSKISPQTANTSMRTTDRSTNKLASQYKKLIF